VELVEFITLWSLLKNVCLRGEVNDSIVWRWTPSGEFSMVSAYSIQFQGSHPPFDTGKIWKAKAKPKVKFFGWTAMHQKILTADILEIRGIQNNHCCPLCNAEPENATHPFSLEVLCLIWSWFRLPGSPRPSSSTHGTVAWLSSTVAKMGAGQAKRSMAILLYCCLNIWKERNSRIFEMLHRNEFQVASSAK
jgi:hypothetical protein